MAIQLNQPDFGGVTPIDAYGDGGFRLAGRFHHGSLLILPDGVEPWPVVSIDGISVEAIRPVLDRADDIELLLIGTGAEIGWVSDDVRKACRHAGIGVDVMATGPASRTYNVVIAEARRVAAALIAVT
jgi:uncharacterized protein